MESLPNQKGFSPIIIAIVLAVIGIGAFVLYKNGTITINNSSSTNVKSNPSGNSDYYNPILGIKLKYPNSWSVTDNYTKDSPIQVMFSKGDIADFRVILPEDSNGKTMEQLNDELKKTFAFAPGSELIEESDITINGLQYHKIITSNTTNNMTTKSLLIWTIKNGKEYAFGYNAKSDQFDALLPEAEVVINSVEIR